MLKPSIAVALLMLLLPAAQAADYRAGEQYTRLDKPVAAAPAVVEFFSFYCGPCYQFAETYRVGSTVSQALPTGTKLTKYHVGLMGKLGHELTEAWAVAMTLGIEDQIEGPLFEAVQKKRAINGVEDIQRVFAAAGVDAATYENARHSLLVKGLVAKQNEAVKALDVRATPSFYVAGKYKIDNAGMASTRVDGYAKEYAAVVRYLLDTQP
ncbi:MULTISPECIES: DsbA family protein [Serratia]|uniref:DsbA family protein n=1 Tax=Serratia TaxID=613 RepID=UPI001013C737|nr:MULTISPECIES: DsbA family protein [Serratia]CAI0999693.1 Thiol:disulfide interchange protein DsbA precursor [Serratia ficaria]CAI1967690.1 Thiol:disulfide interchange protein DsbA precursor [Serratia ficaria]CAI2417311.1 Thiol:disulfide interchange protein DsbA precursor [Serratia ficaria]